MTQRAIQQSFHTCGCAMPGMPVPCPAYGLAPYLARRAAKNGSCGSQEVFFTTFEHKKYINYEGGELFRYGNAGTHLENIDF